MPLLRNKDGFTTLYGLLFFSFILAILTHIHLHYRIEQRTNQLSIKTIEANTLLQRQLRLLLSGWEKGPAHYKLLRQKVEKSKFYGRRKIWEKEEFGYLCKIYFSMFDMATSTFILEGQIIGHNICKSSYLVIQEKEEKFFFIRWTRNVQ